MAAVISLIFVGCTPEQPVEPDPVVYPFYTEGLTQKDGEKSNTDFCDIISKQLVSILEHTTKNEWSSKIAVDLIENDVKTYSVDFRTSYGGVDPTVVCSLKNEASGFSTTFGVTDGETYYKFGQQSRTHSGSDGIQGKLSGLLPTSVDTSMLPLGVLSILNIEGDVLYGVGAYGKTSEYVATVKVYKMLENLSSLANNPTIKNGGGTDLVNKLNSSVLAYVNSAFGLSLTSLSNIQNVLPDMTLNLHLVMESSGSEKLNFIYLKFNSPASNTAVFGGAEKVFDLKIYNIALSTNVDTYNATEKLGTFSEYTNISDISDGNLFSNIMVPDPRLRNALIYARSIFNQVYDILRPATPEP